MYIYLVIAYLIFLIFVLLNFLIGHQCSWRFSSFHWRQFWRFFWRHRASRGTCWDAGSGSEVWRHCGNVRSGSCGVWVGGGLGIDTWRMRSERSSGGARIVVIVGLLVLLSLSFSPVKLVKINFEIWNKTKHRKANWLDLNHTLYSEVTWYRVKNLPEG